MHRSRGQRPVEQALSEGDKWIATLSAKHRWLFKIKLLAIHPFQPKGIPHLTPNSDQFNRLCRKMAVEAIMYLSVGLAVIWVLYSCWIDFSSPILRNFFQRSGAILVAASAAAEFYVARDVKPIKEENTMTVVAGVALLRSRSLMKKVGFAGLIFGTVIWAYGDFAFDWRLSECLLIHCCLE